MHLLHSKIFSLIIDTNARAWGGYNLRVADSTVNTLTDTSALAYQWHTHTHMQIRVTVICVVKPVVCLQQTLSKL